MMNRLSSAAIRLSLPDANVFAQVNRGTRRSRAYDLWFAGVQLDDSYKAFVRLSSSGKLAAGEFTEGSKVSRGFAERMPNGIVACPAIHPSRAARSL
jgi:hypothetical protein